ncbi:MAG: sigma-54 dependent transcriptional regulator, partial [Chitinivibrionales bacterium]|nr:sigma-54 dependent transcriptional regulator [Chitinivibrionales bacterium]
IDPDVPVMMITAFGAVDIAVDAMKKGAHDFIQKSANLLDELEINVERTLQFRSLLTENKRLKSALQHQWDYVGRNGAIEQIRQLVATIAASRSTVLVTGESGTGKELVARSIHYLSPRSSGPFVKVNCAALPEGLIESELFGHEKGAFTGALRERRGKFELAHGGTLLLDEIGEMTIAMQAKLLRVLQEHEISKVGGDEPLAVDVRIVVTTNRTLEDDVKSGKFREDLFYRLNVFHVHLPPLRQRKDDLESLAHYFIRRYNDVNGLSVDGLEPGCLEILRSYEWPGNIRELENALERAVVLTRSGPVTPERLTLQSSGAPAQRAGDAGFEFKPGITVAEAERELILRTLTSCDNNRTKAAEMLGISIRTLRNKLYEYEAA